MYICICIYIYICTCVRTLSASESPRKHLCHPMSYTVPDFDVVGELKARSPT